MAGYTRQSIADIVNGLDITAPPLTAEFNQIDAAFNGTTGHAHDGSTGNGPKVNLTTSVQGYLPAANGGLGGVNKIDATVAPTATNDNVQGYVPGSIWINMTNGRAYRCVGNATNAAVWREEVLVTGGNQITPIATNTVDLGTSAVRFKDAYLGTANTTGAAAVGGNLSVTGTTTLTGATSVGSITASTGFNGPLTGAVTGNVTGDVTGNLTGNVTASTGTSSFNNLTVNGSLDLNSSTSATVTGLSTPVNATDAATKAYVDTQVDDLVILTLSNAEAVTETYVDTADALKLNLTGGTMSGAIAMGTSKITGLGTPTAATDATTKTYVDTADDLKLNLTGGTMSGAIAMGSSKITGLGTPTASTDAVTKGYTDAILPSITGNAGKALTVNSGATGLVWNDSRAVQPAINNGPLSNAGSIVMMMDNGNYTLPDFSGQPGFTLAYAKNSTAADFATVTTSDGWEIAPGFNVAGDGNNLLTALNTTTAHGIWGSSIAVTPPDIASITLSSALNAGSVAGAATLVRASINLDANRILLVVAASSSNHFAVVYDKTTDTFGASVTFTASDNGRYVSLTLMGANSFLLAASDPTTPFNGKIIAGTVSGTTITLGTAYAPGLNLVQIDGFPIIVKLTDTLALTLVTAASGIVNVQALAISGTVITAGTAVSINPCWGPRLLRHSNTEAIITYGTAGTAASGLVRTITVSGTTVTLNATTTIATSLYGAGYRAFDTFVEGQSYLWGGRDSTFTSNFNLRCITVSGTTCTANAATLLTSSLSTAITDAHSKAITLTLPTSYHPNIGTMPVDATTILLNIDFAGVRSVTLSGTDISVSGALSGAYDSLLRKDFAGNLYMVDDSPVTVLRFSVSGGTLTALESVASSTLPNVVPSSTKHDKAIKYGGVWYSWKFLYGVVSGTSVIGAISEDRWLAVSTTDLTKLKVVGPIT